MNEIEKQQAVSKKTEVQEIDLLELAQKVWDGKKLIFKACGVAVVLGLIVAFSIPKEYTTTVVLAPEAKAKGGAGNLGALASMAGINIGSVSGDEALSPEIYPDIVKSTPFLVDLFPVKIKPISDEKAMGLFEYMDKHQRVPWWGIITSAPFKAVGWAVSLFKDKLSLIHI